MSNVTFSNIISIRLFHENRPSKCLKKETFEEIDYFPKPIQKQSALKIAKKEAFERSVLAMLNWSETDKVLLSYKLRNFTREDIKNETGLEIKILNKIERDVSKEVSKEFAKLYDDSDEEF